MICMRFQMSPSTVFPHRGRLAVPSGTLGLVKAIPAPESVHPPGIGDLTYPPEELSVEH